MPLHGSKYVKMAERRAFSQMRCCLVTTGKVSQKCLTVIQQRLQKISHQDVQFFVTSPSDQDPGASKPPNVVIMITVSDEDIYCSCMLSLKHVKAALVRHQVAFCSVASCQHSRNDASEIHGKT